MSRAVRCILKLSEVPEKFHCIYVVCTHAHETLKLSFFCVYVHTTFPKIETWSHFTSVRTLCCIVCLQMKGAVSKVNKKFISHLTRAKRTPLVAATVQVSHALPAVRFSCLLRGCGASF